jgi:hypothetical protein
MLAGAILATAWFAPQSRAKEDALDRRARLWVEGVAYPAWIARFRTCTPEDMKEATQSLGAAMHEQAKGKRRLSIEGRLVPGRAECTLMACKPGPCCNGCDFEWVVEIGRASRAGELKLRFFGARLPLGGGGPDCAVHGYGREADRVIASGRMDGEGAVLIDADLCRLEPKTTNDQMTDADYRRLMSPPRKRPAKKDTTERPLPVAPNAPP